MKTYFNIKSNDNGVTDTIETFDNFKGAYMYLKDCLTSWIEHYEYSIGGKFSVEWSDDKKGFTITETDAFGDTWDYSVNIECWTE